MPIPFVEIAVATVKLVTPYLPDIISAIKGASDVASVLAQKGGQAIESVRQLWGKLKDFFTDDDDVNAAARLLASKPEDEGRRQTLVDVLTHRLQEDPSLAEEILELLGGENRVQEMVVGDEGIIERVRQVMEGGGTQTIQAGRRGRISDADQYMKK